MTRPAHIPPKIWTMARQSGQRNGSHAATVRTAEMLMRRLHDEESVDEDRERWWPGLTLREKRIVGDALAGHDTVYEDDVAALFRLRNLFGSKPPGVQG